MAMEMYDWALLGQYSPRHHRLHQGLLPESMLFRPHLYLDRVLLSLFGKLVKA